MSTWAKSAVQVLTFLSIGFLAVMLFTSAVAADPVEIDVESLGGDGSSESPYQITNVSELQAIEQDLEAHYVLKKDINAGETVDWDNGFEPIGNASDPFAGTFNGSGFTVESLFIDRPDEDFVGLFGDVDGGSIANVSLESATITGNDRVGGLVGKTTGSVTNASVTGTVDGGSQVGGLVGRVEDGTVSESFATATVTATGDHVGGITGYLRNDARLKNSYATGDVKGDAQVGGLVGRTSSHILADGRIEKSYATGAVKEYSGTGGAVGDTVGGLVGWNDETVTDAYWNTDRHGEPGIGFDTGTTSISGLTAEQLRGDPAMTNLGPLDFDGTWNVLDTTAKGNATSYPYLQANPQDPAPGLQTVYADGDGTAAAPYEIVKWRHLNNVRETLDANFTLMADLNESTVGYEAVANTSANDGSGFKPIGNSSAPFEGTFNGSDSVIADLFINRSDTDNIGLFGYITSSGTISQLGVESVNNTGREAVGGLVGTTNGTITATYATGIVDGDSEVGGLAGNVSAGATVHSSYAATNVTGTNQRVGGLVGFLDGGTVRESNATGAVDGATDIGGLVGSVISNGDIKKSHATGNVNGSDNNIGGLVGNFDSNSVNQSYATGDVTGGGDSDYVAGLIGYLANGLVNRSYATGAVNGHDYVGGLIGNIKDGTVTRSFATGSVVGRGTQTGGAVGRNEATLTMVAASGNVTGDSNVGGLIGRNIPVGTVQRSYSKGRVDGGSSVGGIVGFNDGDVVDTYAIGDVHGTNAGGLAGWNNNGDIQKSFAAGRISGTSSLGGVVGYSSDNGNVANLYWDQNRSGRSDGLGSHPDYGVTGLTTDDMQGSQAVDNMTELAFTTIWTTVDGYPVLTWSVDDLDLTLSKDTLIAGESTDATVTLTLVDTSTAIATITSDYRSDDTSIATVDNGTVHAISVGTALLTAETGGVDGTTEISVMRTPSQPSGGGSDGPPEQSLELRMTDESTVEATGGRAGDVVRISEETTGAARSLGGRGTVEIDAISVELAGDRDFWLSVETFEGSSRSRDGVGSQGDDDESEARSAISTEYQSETGTLSAGYVTVTHNLDPEDITTITFEFSVREGRLDAQGVTPEAITLHRQSDGWVALPTEFLETTGTEARFEAISPGFSSFAIGTGEPLIAVTGATLAESELVEGDTATVTTTVENRGEIATEHTVELTADGETVATETVALGPGEMLETALLFEPPAGEYDLSVDGLYFESLAVVKAPTPDSPTPKDEGVVLLGMLLVAVIVVGTLVTKLR